MLPQLGSDGNYQTVVRQAATAGKSKRRRVDTERAYTTNQSPTIHSPSNEMSSLMLA
jgi:hypothetical protein